MRTETAEIALNVSTRKTPRHKAYTRVLKNTLLSFCLGAFLLSAQVAIAQSPEPPIMPTVDRLAAPTMPANPGQADYGAQVYYLVCMACHGDRGQGLTDEWRAAWSPDDQNCWQSKCHAANHPPEGFELVRYVPPVVGDTALARFQNAAELHKFVSTRMPWQAPGSLESDEYWQLTAFLLRANGFYSGEPPIGPENAARVLLAGNRATAELPPVEPPAMPPHGSAPAGWVIATLGALMLTLLAFLVYNRRRARKSR